MSTKLCARTRGYWEGNQAVDVAGSQRASTVEHLEPSSFLLPSAIIRRALCGFDWNFTRWRKRDAANSSASPAPRLTPEGGEVRAAGQARGPDAKPPSNPKPLSVKAFPMPLRVRCGGRRPPLTAPKTTSGWRLAIRQFARCEKMLPIQLYSKRNWASISFDFLIVRLYWRAHKSVVRDLFLLSLSD